MDARWTSVTMRDQKADGTFWYGVTTTRVYCRPSCASRRANPKNVRFFSTIDAAEAAGFRACKRCRPKDASLDVERARLVARACRDIESATSRSENVPKLAELASSAGMSAFHFHRVFKSITGVTPRAYASAHRARRVRASLTAKTRRENTVTDAIYDAGFSSSARFYAQANGILGMTASEARAGGARQTIRFAVGVCSLGDILVAATDKGVCAIWLGEASSLVRELEETYPKARLEGGDRAFEHQVAQVIAWVESPSRDTSLPLDIRGTAFQQRVWRALRDIPAGVTATYADVAKSIGAPKSVRAVASACAANELAIAIPCHRVVRSDGSLSGYRWGVERKRSLLERERSLD